MNKDLNKDIINEPETNHKTKSNIIKKEEGKYKFKRSTVIYNFIDFIVKKVYLINDHLDLATE
jgi:hypothetical protein